MTDIYIHYVFNGVKDQTIRETLKSMDIGEIQSIRLMKRKGKEGTKGHQSAVIKFKSWNTSNSDAVALKNHLDAGKRAKIPYDTRDSENERFWILVKNKTFERPKPMIQLLEDDDGDITGGEGEGSEEEEEEE